jgi:small subunit ribosomal protein S16
LRRVGRKKLPIYKVVAADSRAPRDGRFIEAVGQYEPLRKSNNVVFTEERVLYWLRNGALPTQTVRNLLSDEGLWLKWSLLKKGTDDATIAKELERFAMLREERQKKAEEKASAKSKVKEEPKEEPKETSAPAEESTPEPEAAEQKVEPERPAESDTQDTAESDTGPEQEDTPKEE